MTQALAPDDIIRRPGDVAEGARAPLVVIEPLAELLAEHGLGDGDPARIEVTPIGDGHSNVTLAVSGAGGEVILRRPPRGPLPPSAHDVLREARLLRALEHTPVRVPRVLLACDDASVIGAPFYLMERVEGEVITTSMPPALDGVAERAGVAAELIDALVEVHAVDWSAVGLEGLGKPTGYLERQLRRFTGLWEHNRTRELPAVEQVAAWLGANLPESPPATIVHGDYRLGNTLFASEPPARLAAILDWEMATIGDPLADLGYLMMFWAQADDPPVGRFDLQSVMRLPGFPSRAEVIARYEERSGRSLSSPRWYLTLALWKSVVFMEGNYKRAMAGTTDDPYLRSFGAGVVQLAERALEVSQGAG
ncbi:MAG TPA: phosphotransferase family protein [Solirubrobacteraceae bacterium]|jgi:aminoglycoside phosphotransferase (APT) family kinase protein|nr:phosphotransferase family protein [Solirubrobacteraceae bacterium]